MIENMEPGTVTQEELNALELAGRGSRLVAAILDSLFMMLAIIPLMWLTGGFDGISTGEPLSFAYSTGIGLYGYGVFIVLNGKLLLTGGQTLGKKLQGIKIVTLSDTKPELYPHLLKRYAVFFLIGYLPYLGGLLSLGNLALIFTGNRRCGHDLFANTKVVKS